jgi:conserved repeat domain
MACTYLGIANDFNLFLFGNLVQSHVGAEGRVVVGGNATYNSCGAGDKLSAALAGTTVDFAAAERDLAQLSLNLAAITANGTVTNHSGQIVLTGSDPLLNVFMFNGNNADGNGLRLAAADSINIIAPAESTILINVGDNNVGFGSYTICRNGVTAAKEDGGLILWNFYQAVTAFNQNLSIVGSVLAPYAHWEAIGFGNINGTLVANSLTDVGGTLKAHNCPFIGCLPEDTTGTSSTTNSSMTTSADITGPIITATKTSNVTTVQIGDTITYTITVTNTGAAPGEALLVEVLPPVVQFIPSSLFMDGSRLSGVDITEQLAIGLINAGQVVTIQFDAFVAGYPPNGQITNAGFIVAVPPGTLPATGMSIHPMQGITPVPGLMLPVLPVFKPGVTPAPGQALSRGPLTIADGRIMLNQSATVPGIALTPLVGLTVSVLTGTVQPQPIISAGFVTVPMASAPNMPNLLVSTALLDISLFVGQRITCTIFVINNGNTVSGRTTLMDSLPVNALFIPGTVRVNRVLRLDANPNEGIRLGPLTPNQSAIIQFDVLLRESGSLTNNSQVKAEFLLPNQQILVQTFQSNTLSHPVSTIRASDFASFLKTADAQIVKAGDNYHYNITLTNLSSDITAGNVIFYDPLDNQLQFVSGSLTVDGIPQHDPQAGIPLGTIGPGATRRLTFQVNVLAEPMGGMFINQAAVLFEFRRGASCFRAGMLTNTVRILVEGDEP